MVFLIVYSRAQGKLLSYSTFEDEEIVLAQAARLAAELDADVSADVEAVILRAESESAIRKSHARYFENASMLLDDLREGAAAP